LVGIRGRGRSACCVALHCDTERARQAMRQLPRALGRAAPARLAPCAPGSPPRSPTRPRPCLPPPPSPPRSTSRSSSPASYTA
jgi:hypothetical protein